MRTLSPRCPANSQYAPQHVCSTRGRIVGSTGRCGSGTVRARSPDGLEGWGVNGLERDVVMESAEPKEENGRLRVVGLIAIGLISATVILSWWGWWRRADESPARLMAAGSPYRNARPG